MIIYNFHEVISGRVKRRLPPVWQDPVTPLVFSSGLLLLALSLVVIFSTPEDSQRISAVVEMGLLVAALMIVGLAVSGYLIILGRAANIYRHLVAETIQRHGGILLLADWNVPKRDKSQINRILSDWGFTVLDGRTLNMNSSRHPIVSNVMKLIDQRGIKYILRLYKVGAELVVHFERLGGGSILQVEGRSGRRLVTELLHIIPLDVKVTTLE